MLRTYQDNQKKIILAQEAVLKAALFNRRYPTFFQLVPQDIFTVVASFATAQVSHKAPDSVMEEQIQGIISAHAQSDPADPTTLILAFQTAVIDGDTARVNTIITQLLNVDISPKTIGTPYHYIDSVVGNDWLASAFNIAAYLGHTNCYQLITARYSDILQLQITYSERFHTAPPPFTAPRNKLDRFFASSLQEAIKHDRAEMFMMILDYLTGASKQDKFSLTTFIMAAKESMNLINLKSAKTCDAALIFALNYYYERHSALISSMNQNSFFTAWINKRTTIIPESSAPTSTPHRERFKTIRHLIQHFHRH